MANTTRNRPTTAGIRRVTGTEILAQRRARRRRKARAQLICAAIFLPINAALAWTFWPAVAETLRALAN